VDDAAGPDADLLRYEQVELVHEGLAALDAEHRQILVLREIDGLRYEEIAEILELPIGTVRSRLFRARLQLRDRLAARMKTAKVADTR
jgi:RNA polymerase sigma-70 factor (ECF subfamily)